jgi:anti-sigma-K factor RskA
MDYGRPELADRLASAYVAGTLRGAARKRFEALLPAHPNLRRSTSAWEERLMPLTATLPPVAPPSRLWQRILSRIDGSAASTAAVPNAGRGFSALAFWRGLTAATGLAALALAVLLAMPAPVQPPIVVVLAAAGAAPGRPQPLRSSPASAVTAGRW